MVLIKHLPAVRIRFGGEEHSGWLPANASLPPPTAVEAAVVNFEISEVEGGYIFEWHSRNTSHGGDLWYETLEDALESASIDWAIRPEQWRNAERGGQE